MKRLLTTNSNWQAYLINKLNCNGITLSSLIQNKELKFDFKHNLYNSIHTKWKQIINDDEDNFWNESLWHNNKLKIDNKSFFWRSWWNKGISNITHLCDEKNELMTYFGNIKTKIWFKSSLFTI